MNKIRAAIIEDEIPAARLLNKMLTELRPEWEILVLPGNVEGGIRIIPIPISSFWISS